MKLDVLESFRLQGRVALVTGASRGFGEVIASALAEAGASLALLARGERVHEVARTLSAEHGVECRAWQCDVGDAGAVQETVAAAIADCGGLHIVVNNAGLNIRGPIEELSVEQYRQVQDANVTSMWLVCRAAAAHLKAQRYGRVVNIGSLLSILGMPERTPYAVSKAGVLALTRVLALEWAPAGITVNCIIPGVFATEMNRPLLDDPETRAGVAAKVPLGRWGEPAEVAGMALYLAGDAASYVTGAALTVDGGWSVH